MQSAAEATLLASEPNCVASVEIPRVPATVTPERLASLTNVAARPRP